MPNINLEQLRPILSHTTSLRQAYNMTYIYSIECLNFVAFWKPNKHKMRSKGFFYNLAGFVFEHFCDIRRILATFAKFCLISLFATRSYRFTCHPVRALKLPSISHTSFLTQKVQNPSPSPNCYRQISLKRFWY